MRNNYKLKDCPFCGSPYASTPEMKSYYNSYTGRQYFVECMNCGATSCHKPTEEHAVKAWNKREQS